MERPEDAPAPEPLREEDVTEEDVLDENEDREEERRGLPGDD